MDTSTRRNTLINWRDIMKDFRAKADQFFENSELFGKRAEAFYELGNFEESAKWIRAEDEATENANYFMRLALKEEGVIS